MKRRLSIASLLAIAIALGLAGALYLAIMRGLERVTPPDAVNDIYSFLEWQPETKHFVVIETEGDEPHLMATGSFRFLPSGPSAYVFDRRGRFIDWSFDIGDDPRFDRRWSDQRAQSSENIMRPNEVHAWLEAGSAGGKP